MKKLFLGIGILILGLILYFSSDLSYQSPRYVKLVDQITKKTAVKLRKDKGLVLSGIGGGMIDDIKKLNMSFDYFQEVDVDKARILLVEAAQEYLTAINTDLEVRPFLHNYPFTTQNIEIVILFRKPDGGSVPSKSLLLVSARKGICTYSIDDPEKHSLKYIHKETFEEALEQVSSKKSVLENKI